MNAKVNMRRKSALMRMREKQANLRSGVFHDIDEDRIWDVKNRAKTKGYSSIPRTISLMGSIMDMLSGKGKPVFRTFLELWCRSDEKGFLILSKPNETAFASGFTGERGVSSWKERVRCLERLGFISTKPGASGDLAYVQIWNPYIVIREHIKNKTEGFRKSTITNYFKDLWISGR